MIDLRHMTLTNRKGLTLIESLVCILLLSTLFIGILGAFYVSRLGAARAEHRITACNIVKSYLEQELLAGYGIGDYTILPAAQIIGGITYNVARNPEEAVLASEGGTPYKTVGFTVIWTEEPSGQLLSESVATQVAMH